MFTERTVLDITDLPTEVKTWAYHAYRENTPGNGSYITVWPAEVLYQPGYENENETLNLNEMRIKTLEEFFQEYENGALYEFLRWCIEQGQSESFLLLYWW